jgi:hypothetical protein
MHVFLLIVATGIVMRVAMAAVRVISAARLDHALRIQAPTSADLADVMSDEPVEVLRRSA